MGRRRLTRGALGLLLVALAAACVLPGLNQNPTVPPTATPTITPAPAGVTPQPPAQITPSTSGQLPAWLIVHFTNPNPPDNVAGGIDQYVVPILKQATGSIDIASFDFNLPSVLDALVQAHQHGVTVRIVLDLQNGEHELAAKLSPTGQAIDALKTLQDAGIQVVDGGRSNGLMHDKIIIVDGRVLIMGSWNLSYNDTFRNNNNLLIITDPTLIANYAAKFNELYVDQRFGTKSQLGAQTPVMNIGGVAVANYFSPHDEVMQKLVALVQGAQHSVRFMIFTYTHKDLSDAMIARHKAGVDVRGIIENRGASEGALVPLYCAGVPVKVDGNKYTMHHKVMVIDDQIVVTGSFNFTNTADNANDDNVLIISDAAVAQLYLAEFDRLEAIAKAPNSADLTCQ